MPYLIVCPKCQTMPAKIVTGEGEVVLNEEINEWSVTWRPGLWCDTCGWVIEGQWSSPIEFDVDKFLSCYDPKEQ